MERNGTGSAPSGKEPPGAPPPAPAGNVDVPTLYRSVQDLYTESEFEDEIRRVTEEFHGLIDRETAALCIAVTAGRIPLEERPYTSLGDGDHVTVSGVISRMEPLRTFTRKDGSTGRVRSLLVTQNGRDLRVSFWESRDFTDLEDREVTEGMGIRVINGRVKVDRYGTTVNVGGYTKVMFGLPDDEGA